MKVSKGIYNIKGCNCIAKGYNFSITAKPNSKVELLIYDKNNLTSVPDKVVLLSEEYRMGNVYSVFLEDINLKKCAYNYKINGIIVCDPYGKAVFVDDDGLYKSLVTNSKDFDWGDDKRLGIPYNEMIIYRMHVKGFTKGIGSKVKKKGTFHGIIEKIPYLKELGITTIELLPIHEYIDKNPNYWGYAGGYYFSPNRAYSSDKKLGGQVEEFKKLVKELHKNGIEIILEQYYMQGENPEVVIDSLKYWIYEYHVDGIHIISYNDVEKIIAELPEFSEVKIFGNSWWNIDFSHKYLSDNHNLFEYNDSFMNTAKMFLKGDENQVSAFIGNFKANPKLCGKVNYISHTNSFTLYDLVSYERKHNEINGENNRDGADFNYSWNCGIEGDTKNKKVQALRLKQMKNILCMLMLSQAVPMILSGDEFANTQKGNNNPYCQDNEITWLDWRGIKKNNELFEFVKSLIAFRKKHPVLRQKSELTLSDYKAVGTPDISFHGEKAWYPQIEVYQRIIGIFLCGEYVKVGDVYDDDIYIVFNMHWEEHSFAIPDTCDSKEFEICLYTGEKKAILTDRSVIVEPRSVLVMTKKGGKVNEL